ncbi:MAG: hypothetical protein ACF8LL_12020 [Phycisphaerales bacterium]
MTQEADEFIRLRAALEERLAKVAAPVGFDPDLLGHHLAELHGYCTRTAAAITQIANGDSSTIRRSLREVRVDTFDHVLPHHMPEMEGLIRGLSDALSDAGDPAD